MNYFFHRILSHRLIFSPLAFIRAFVVLAICLGGSASAQDAHYKLVSPAFAAGDIANQHSFNPAISADGRFIAFASQATNLVSFPTRGGCCLPGQGMQNVFIRDVQAGTTKLVSINLAGHDSGNGSSGNPSISADGRFVTFFSTASDLVDNDTNGNGTDVFIRDTVNDTTTLVSSNSTGTGSLAGNSSSAVMSPDGRFVAFLNTAPDSAVSNVFLRDLLSGTTKLVSVNRSGTGGGNGSSSAPSISADGRIVSFQSVASDLLASPVFGAGIYVRDLKSAVTTQVPPPPLEFPQVFRRMGDQTVSADGRYVIFDYSYSQLIPQAGDVSKGNVARFDLQTNTFSILPDSGVCTNEPLLCTVSTFRPSASADGRFVTFAQVALGSTFSENVFLGDFLSLKTTNVVSQGILFFNAFPSPIIRPVISADGRSVAFSTYRRLLSQDGNPLFMDVYRFDHDPDPDGRNGVISFGQSTFGAEEGGGSVNIPVLRSALGASGPTTVQFATANGTANAGSDYTATSGTLTFAPGEEVKFINVPLLNDNVREGTETFAITLSNPTDGYVLGGATPTAVVNIHDSIKPSFTIDDAATTEGGDAVFTVTLSEAPLQFSAVKFSVVDGTARGQDGDYDLDATSIFRDSLVFNPGQRTNTITVHTKRDFANEPDETFFVNLSPLMNDYVIEREQGTGTIHDDRRPVVEFVHFGANFSDNESAGSTVIIVKRTSGDPSVSFSVNYATSDDTASERSDYTATLGRLDFAAGELSKTFTVLLNDDVFVESRENVTLTLSSPTNGAILGTSTEPLFIDSDDSRTPTVNPLDESRFFVTQHYKDFLNRLPDQSGLDFWTNELNTLLASCDSLPAGEAKRQCVLLARAQVSTAFFLSIESQQTGYLVYRFYRASLNRAPTLREFLADTQEIGRDVVVGAEGWEQKFEANKQKFADDWVHRPDFRATFDPMPNNVYVSMLFHFGSGDPSAEASLQQTLVGGLNATPATETRATVLRKVADSRTIFNRQYNPGLVLMQYFTYLRRNPDDPPDNDLDGYNFWLAKLDEFSVPGEDVRNADTALTRIKRAQMIEAFIDSTEYRHRLGP